MEIPSNLLSRAYTKHSHLSNLSAGRETGTPSMYAFFLCTDVGRGGHEGVLPKLIRKPLKFCQALNLDQQKAKACWHSIWARGILYCVLEIPRVGEEAMPRDGWYFSFMPTLLLKTVCFSLHLKIPVREKVMSSLSYQKWCPAQRVVNKCHITFIPFWLRMMFSQGVLLAFKFLSKSPKLQHISWKGALLKASILLESLPRFHPCAFTHLFPGLLASSQPCSPPVLLSFSMSPAAFIGKSVIPHFTLLIIK